MATTTFSLSYVLSLLVALLAYFFIAKATPQSKLFLRLLVGIFAGYLALLIFNAILPSLNTFGSDAANYIVNKSFSGLNSMQYMYIFPPLFIILVLFLALLYSGNLG